MGVKGGAAAYVTFCCLPLPKHQDWDIHRVLNTNKGKLMDCECERRLWGHCTAERSVSSSQRKGRKVKLLCKGRKIGRSLVLCVFERRYWNENWCVQILFLCLFL